ncbi:MAG TPA: ABC transporter permease subunit [Nocardioidaceae bacterium]|nr:ABC transporter permease subunit [Nocardioidaceae bacterium]
MFIFILRRFVTSALVVLASTFVMYILTDIAIDPLDDLRTSTAPNKQQLIEGRIAQLRLDEPVVTRYVDWLAGASKCVIGQCDLGTAWRSGQSVTSMLGGAILTTIQLVTAATLLAILVGVAVGIVSALRQYSGFDYSVTFLSFLLYSLPVFWVAVLLKQYAAIGFNTFLADPHLGWPTMIGISLVSGLIWAGIAGGSRARRLRVLGVGTAATLAVLAYIDVTSWLSDPGLGIVAIAVLGAGIAFLATHLSTGLRNTRARNAALTTAAIGVALYYPLQYFYYYVGASWPIMFALLGLTLLVSVLVGWAWGGPDWKQSARTATITAVPVAALLFIDRVMSVWQVYSESNLIKGRPIATIGPKTPGMTGDFWIENLDSFTHLLLPTIALVLISFAGYTRYSRASMLEVMNQDYIRTARAKGLTERTVVMRHAFRNSLIPLASIVPVDIITLVGGAVITETIFNWFGMGRLFVVSLDGDEIDPIMAYLLIVGVLAVLANFVADLLYAVLDPRIRVNA